MGRGSPRRKLGVMRTLVTVTDEFIIHLSFVNGRFRGVLDDVLGHKKGVLYFQFGVVRWHPVVMNT